jgi:hypothetical protein
MVELLKRKNKLCTDEDLQNVVSLLKNDINYDIKKIESELSNRQIKIIRWIIKNGESEDIDLLLSAPYYYSRIKKYVQSRKKRAKYSKNK